jgi:hypothetical protein
MKKSIVLAVLLFIFTARFICGEGYSDSSNAKPETTKRKHSIDLKIAYWNVNSGVSITTPGVSIDVGFGGISGKIVYNYYPNNVFSFFISAGGMVPKVSINTLSNHTCVLSPIAMGLKYYLTPELEDNTFQPYIAGGMEILVGSESSVEILSVGSHTESAMGAYAGVGTDILVSRLIKFSMDIGYNLISDFAEPLGGRKNYTGPEFSFGIGLMF